jgi:hypothetical protein
MDKSKLDCPLMLAIGVCMFENECGYDHRQEMVSEKKRTALKIGKDYDPSQKAKTSEIFQQKEEYEEEKFGSSNKGFQIGNNAAEMVMIDNMIGQFGDDDCELDRERGDYFHENSKDCKCCKGFINQCSGNFCANFGYCFCYAEELEEQEYASNVGRR